MWRQLKMAFGVADPDPEAQLAAKLAARAQAIAAWIAGHDDRDKLKRDLEQAGLAWAEIRHGGEALDRPAIAGRGTIVEVAEGEGGRRSVVRMPYRFSDAETGPVRGAPATGEHTRAVLAEWTGLTGRAGRIEPRHDSKSR
jgi:crotonobetainyl-CoA:carnitine CoA-transferase CaiB-like acyl-CoA transferase